MPLSQQLESQLNATAGSGPAHLVVRDGAEQLDCELSAIDSLGVSVQRLELRSPKLAGLTAEKLREVADDLAARVGYLLEAIAPIEVDEQACSVQMRSTPPHRAENATSYYEVLVKQSSISLKRYNKSKREARRAEPYAITREVLLRLADDFAATADSA